MVKTTKYTRARRWASGRGLREGGGGGGAFGEKSGPFECVQICGSDYLSDGARLLIIHMGAPWERQPERERELRNFNVIKQRAWGMEEKERETSALRIAYSYLSVCVPVFPPPFSIHVSVFMHSCFLRSFHLPRAVRFVGASAR